MTERFTSSGQRPYPWPGLSRDKQALPSLDRTEIPCRYRPDAPHLEKLTDLCELATVWMHEQERIFGASFLGMVIHLTAQQPQHEYHEKVHAFRAAERRVRWPDERDDDALRPQNLEGFL